MYILVYPSRHVEFFRFASLLMEHIQCQNFKPMFVGYKNYGAKSSHSVFYSQGLKDRAIQTEFESVYAPEAAAISTLKKWRERFHEGRTDLIDDLKSRRPVTQEFAATIQSMLTQRPFLSCKVLFRHLSIRKVTCLPILHNDLGLIKVHLHWIPEALKVAEKSERLSYSRQLLAILEQQQPMDFEYDIIRDEFWFYLYNRPEAAWTVSRYDLPERIKRKIDTGKCLISVL
jgi:hypothetical protein